MGVFRGASRDLSLEDPCYNSRAIDVIKVQYCDYGYTILSARRWQTVTLIANSYLFLPSSSTGSDHTDCPSVSVFAAETRREASARFLGLDLGICVTSRAPVQSAPRYVFGRCLLIARIALCSRCRSVCWHIPAKPQQGGEQDVFWEVAQRGRCLYGFTEVYRKPCVELPLFLPPFFPVFFPPPMYPSSLCYT